MVFLVILIPILQGFVQPFREGLIRVVYGLRILKDQTCSANEAVTLHLEYTNTFLKRNDIEKTKQLIIVGLCIIGGVVPICLLVPTIHYLCHYGDGTTLLGASTFVVDDDL